jgi:hypothetical protein
MYDSPVGLAEFGDVFSADWLFDAYLRGDAVALNRTSMKSGTTGYVAAPATNERDLVLAHGKSCMAVLMADDCEAESMIQRRSAPTSRLLFAGLRPWPAAPNEVDRALKATSFRRHPLEPATSFAGGIVDFQLMFAVAAEAVAASPDRRVVRLDPPRRLALEIRWCAFSTRRGPRAHLDNVEKLAQLVTAGGDATVFEALREGARSVEPDVKTACLAVANTLSEAWGIEGDVMSAIADAHERCDPADESLRLLIERLSKLGDMAAETSRLLSMHRSSS